MAMRIFLLLLILFIGIGGFLAVKDYFSTYVLPEIATPVVENIKQQLPTATPKVSLQTPPPSKILPNNYHTFQSYNNCGPAALSMALSYYGIQKSQQELGQSLRPYQIPGGDNDDKSVTLEEVAEKSKEFGLIPYLRPVGDIEKIKLFISYDIPVIARTWLKPNDDIGHYRIIKGYAGNTIIQDDSLQGKNLRYSENEFNDIWKKFNYEYLVLVPAEKKEIVEAILGEDLDEKVALQKSIKISEQQLQQNPNDTTARFNLSVTFYHLGNYQKSVEEFEKVENQLSFRTLWYQIEPILSYYELGNYTKAFEITDKILNNHNRAFSELYLLRGNIYLKQGNTTSAKQEFEKAVMYNQSLKSAKDALNSLN